MTALVTTEAAPEQLTGLAEVIKPGIQTTVQDGTGRTGFWNVGVPPSGAYDRLSFALACAAVGNSTADAGLECVVTGPVLRFQHGAVIALAGAATAAELDGRPVPVGEPVVVPPGGVLNVGRIGGPGLRGYLAVAGGIDVPAVLGSRSTFVLGKFGGLAGRALRSGDVLPLGVPAGEPLSVSDLLPRLTSDWSIRVLPGPHGAPGHLTEAGVDELFTVGWTVDHRADRSGLRLLGPKPLWARTNGGEAGMHPSNVHDSAYPVGGVMLCGDVPVIVGPDGPSLGGFVVPCAVIEADLWMLGQVRPGDTIRLLPVDPAQARQALADQRALLGGRPVSDRAHRPVSHRLPPALASVPADGHRPGFTVRWAGDRHLLVEAGPAEFDLTVRMWIHLLATALREDRPAAVSEIVEGVRSLLVAMDGTDPDGATSEPPAGELPLEHLAAHLVRLSAGLPDPATVTLAVREVIMPIAFDDPQVHLAMERYSTVNPAAAWNPDNIEFVRRVNALPERASVFDIMSAATYLVIGLGDVYLGAPVAVPMDPRHRLLTTKYNPARTWTPQNAVGIGGIYLCIYGMEGPGGYQLVGRTVPIWRLSDRDEQPWLLRQFDRIRFVPVTPAELDRQRAEILAGIRDLEVRPASFELAEVAELTATHRAEIDSVRAGRQAAFDAELARWGAAG